MRQQSPSPAGRHRSTPARHSASPYQDPGAAPAHGVPAHGAPVIEARDLRKVYGTGEARVEALAGVSLAVPRGEFLAIMGASGSAKTTLMHCLAGLERNSVL